MKNKKIMIWMSFLILVFDQIAKIFFINKDITIIPRFLSFTYTENTGVAFGIGTNNVIMIIIVNVIILGFIVKFLKERNEQVGKAIIVSLNLILAGGISNLIDRIVRGFVVDFIKVNIFDFPNFNIADISITIGIIILIMIITRSLFAKEKI